MKHLLYLSIFVAVSLMSSCDMMNKQSALDINNKIAKATIDLENKGKAWGTAFGQAYSSSKNFSSLTPIRKDLETSIDKSISDISNMKDVGGSETLRSKALDYLKYEKNEVETYFKPFEEFNSSTSDADVKAKFEALTNSTTEEGQKLADLHAEQQAFATKNNFKLETKSE